MNQDPVHIVQLGCGYWGPNLVRNFASLPGCRLRAVVEPSPARRDFVRTHFPSVPVASDWTAAIGDPDTHAVVIATPAGTHFAMARACLEAGKHVFVEKPIAMSVREVDILAGLAEARGLVLMAGHTFLYNGAVRHVRQRLETRDLGDVYYFCSRRLNLGQARSDVNAWWNLAPHDVSILLYWMNNEPPESVVAHGTSYLQPGIEDVVFGTLTWAGGVVAQLHVSWLDPEKVRWMSIVGSRKMAVYDDIAEQKVTILDKGIDRVPKAGERMDYDDVKDYRLVHRTGSVEKPALDLEEPLRVEARHFLDCIRRREQPLTGPAHARNVVAVLEAGQKSIKAGGARVALKGILTPT